MATSAVETISPSNGCSINRGEELYLRAITDLVEAKILATSMTVLVVCGGAVDRDTLRRAGFTHFVVSNLDKDGAGRLAEGEWSYQDAEALTYPDNSFDFCIVHHGLHHCRSPHKAIGEMLRVARLGTLTIEPADNHFTSLGVRLGFGQDYEHAAVHSHDYLFGGVRNSSVPNYIYRFTAREIRKTALCFEPTQKLEFKFNHSLQVPWAQLTFRKSGMKKLTVRLVLPVLLLAQALLPRAFANQIVSVILKQEEANSLHPWLVRNGSEISPNKQWFAARYGAKTSGNE
jgi:SAM-dependent methyltransferase